MKRTNIIETLSILGECMVNWGDNASIEAFPPVIAKRFYEEMNHRIQTVKHKNGWFTEDTVRESLKQLGKELTTEKLTDWTSNYPSASKPKKVGLILAGNIPLVGFHDVISVLLSGNKAMIKFSHDDDYIFPILLDILLFILPEFVKTIKIVEKLNDIDAVIATGSDNSSRYFEKYFGHLPHIIRKNRTSIAVLTGEEKKEELVLLGKDLFTYFGLGCRNVSHLLLPKGYNLDNIFGAIVDYGEIINHKKYGNNYDYYKAFHLMNGDQLTENGFVLFRETEELFAPIAVVNYHFYSTEEEKDNYIKKYQDKIQVIIGKGYHAFGSSQSPSLTDYADGVDTMQFLTKKL